MSVVAACGHEFERHRRLIERAVTPLTDEELFRHPAPSVNSLALIVKHLAGNLASRWSDFLTSDGDKPSRDRDNEFVIMAADTRVNLMAGWDRAWSIVGQTLVSLSDADLDREITIRGEPHTVLQALLRGVSHTAYHAGQVLYVTRLLRPDAPWLTIAPGQSRQHGAGRYLQQS
ncbi:MAG: DUF1572 domain-containing protein [Pirellulales bacterium]|nr:DUF1572 domain-containing protein [Pirellulales bacterium]